MIQGYEQFESLFKQIKAKQTIEASNAKQELA